MSDSDPSGMDELGAHVSAAGGVRLVPGRAREIGAVVFQLFTKQPARWAEPGIPADEAEAFRAASGECGIRFATAHDSYLINLASPVETLRSRSRRAFEAELRRCEVLGLDALVTHPGNATDGDRASGIARNAEALGRALEAVPGRTRVLLELTAGSGTSVGGSFEDLASILDRLPPEVRLRTGVCVDTCHGYAAGYDWVGDYEGVWSAFDDVLGLPRLGLLHMNDSLHPLGARKDRHAEIGEGTLGPEPFRRLMRDGRLRAVPKILETPKGDDPVIADRRNLERLRRFRAE
ncbi:MAG TPA: deoxyribonuclease IV [Longimicrobiaceae bacterium]|nr:deoxyribonuclease IV [Longimicrobiaceae bacterium]